MKVCHVCKAVCEDGAELCYICGAELTESDGNGTEQERVIEHPVLLATMEDVVSAEIFKDILKDNGIPYSNGESDEETALNVVFGGNFAAEKLYVNNDDFEIADKLYKEFLESETIVDEDFFIEDEEEF